MSEEPQSDQAKTKAQLLRELQELRDHYDQAEERIVRRERMVALAKIARGVVHDINNSLTPIIGAADFMVSHDHILDDREQTKKLLSAIRSAATETKELINRLRAFYRPTDISELRNVRVDKVITGVVLLLEPRRAAAEAAAGAPVVFETDLQESPPVRASETQIRETLIEILLNSLAALEKGGTIKIRVRAEDPGTHITISDDGVGMERDMLAHCFEPFVSSKSESGTGIGLARAYFVVHHLDGVIDISSTPGDGTRVHMSLPASPDSEVLPPLPSSDADDPLDVLLIDGDNDAREVSMAHLKAAGHIVEFARESSVALQTLSVCRFDVVLVGDRVPGMLSGDLIGKLRATVPDTAIVFLSGHETSTSDVKLGEDGVDAVVSRHSTCVEIDTALRTAVGDTRGRSHGGDA